MPVKSLNSSVIKWPNHIQVDKAVRVWAAQLAPRHPELAKLGYFGSYARGDWGVGSDLDLIALIAASDLPFERRPLSWDLLTLPVPAEILVYTLAEWQQMQVEAGLFADTLAAEVVWIYSAD